MYTLFLFQLFKLNLIEDIFNQLIASIREDSIYSLAVLDIKNQDEPIFTLW